jgi:hypothetical protein
MRHHARSGMQSLTGVSSKTKCKYSCFSIAPTQTQHTQLLVPICHLPTKAFLINKGPANINHRAQFPIMVASILICCSPQPRKPLGQITLLIHDGQMQQVKEGQEWQEEQEAEQKRNRWSNRKPEHSSQPADAEQDHATASGNPRRDLCTPLRLHSWHPEPPRRISW